MDKILNILIKLRVNELTKRPSYGSMLIKQSLVENDSWCKVFSTDGENFYYNKNSIKNYNADNVVWFMYHSIFHCILGNLEIPEDYDKDTWNIASDIEVYYTLKSLSLGSAPIVIQKNIHQYNELFDGKNADEIYTLIQTNYIDIKDLEFIRIDDHLDIKENELEPINLEELVYGNNSEDEEGSGYNSEENESDSDQEDDQESTDGISGPDEDSEPGDGNGDSDESEDEGDDSESDQESDCDCESDSKSKSKNSSQDDSQERDDDGDDSNEDSDDNSDSDDNQEDSDSDNHGDSQKDNFKDLEELKESDKDSRPILDEDTIKKFNREYKAQLINIGSEEKEKFPGNMLRLVSEYTEPKIDWKSILTNTIQTIFDKDDYNFAKPSKRSYATGRMDVILPSQSYAKTIDICVSIDSSGSITTEIFNEFVTEVRSIIELYNDYKLHIWCIDTQIYNPKVFTPDNIGELDDYPFAGGGGNDFDENWRFMEENDIVPELFVVLSDGEPLGSWGDADYCETIFVIRNEYREITAPFGTTVQMIPQIT